jgi:diguanylate cyclase (GGDEF)-like protein
MRTDLKSYLSKLFAGDLSAFGGPSIEEEISGRIRASQLALVLGHTPGIMLANVCNATVFALALWPSPEGTPAAIWASVMVCWASFFGVKARASWRVAKPQFVSQRAIHRLVRNALVAGAMWAMLPTFFFANAGNGGQLVITCLCSGMLAGGAFAFATVPMAAIAFTAPIVLGIAICLGQIGEFIYLLIAILVLVYTCALLRGVFSYSFEFTRRLIAQLETEKAVRQDTLTRLPNRFAFNECLESEFANLARGGQGFGILLLDLDGFKEINDQLGHPAGDEFLVQVAGRLRRSIREKEFIARIGGDEFALIASNLHGAEDAIELAERIVAALADPIFIEGREITGATAGVGVALAPRDGNKPNDLLKHVDMALYRAKKAGSGAIRFFDPADDVSTAERRQLQRDLEKAIERDELFLVYQPVLDLRENCLTGFEALLRWRHPTRGLVPPAEFIAIAEETGMIHAIGEWVIRQACAMLSQWPSDVKVAVNFSAVQFRNASVLQTIVRALADNRVSPERFEIEITESMLISKYESALATLRSLLSLGVTVALDDFGTGFSSLTYLRQFPFSRIKIDQSFIREMLVNSDCAAIVRSVVGLARDMKINVVAEGVETSEELDYLRQASCDEVQGYFIGRPMLAGDTLALLDRREQESTQAA